MGFDDVCSTGLVLGLGFSCSDQASKVDKAARKPAAAMSFEPSLTLSLSGETFDRQAAAVKKVAAAAVVANKKQKQDLARELSLRPRQVEVWFQNRRARTKLKQTEVDCEFLKKCCETLTDENRRLQKEVQELKALKLAQPFYMQLPAATLTMCPSCERIGGAAVEASNKSPFTMAPKPHFFNPFTNPSAAC
nr:homeobox-leucine zipper protein HAT22-like [Ipomoea batatas]